MHMLHPVRWVSHLPTLCTAHHHYVLACPLYGNYSLYMPSRLNSDREPISWLSSSCKPSLKPHHEIIHGFLAVPANSVFLPPAVWQQSDQGRDPNWSLSTALEAAGLSKPTQQGALMTRRYSFDTSPPPAPALVKVI